MHWAYALFNYIRLLFFEESISSLCFNYVLLNNLLICLNDLLKLLIIMRNIVNDVYIINILN